MTITTANSASTFLITQRQSDFLASLATERVTDGLHLDQQRDLAEFRAGELITRTAASGLISALLVAPKVATKPVAPASTTLPDVPAGRYAVDGEDGALKFYKVDRPESGRWAGYTFVKVQASDDFHPVRGKAVAAVLAKIAVDPKAASVRYGREIGACGVCGRTLTDPESIDAGIGPICAAKF